jgi:hypothetical protein
MSFNRKSSAFLLFFNFTCILIAAILSLSQSIIDFMNPQFLSTETMGWVTASAIFVNTKENTLFSSGAVVIEIYNKIRLARSSKNRKKENKTIKVKKINIKPSNIPINQNRPQKNFENDPHLISRVTN